MSLGNQSNFKRNWIAQTVRDWGIVIGMLNNILQFASGGVALDINLDSNSLKSHLQWQLLGVLTPGGGRGAPGC